MTAKDNTSSLTVSVPLENYRFQAFECAYVIGALQHCGLQQPELLTIYKLKSLVHSNNMLIFAILNT